MIVSEYFGPVFNYETMRERAEAALAGVKYDVLVGMGVSGMLGAAVVGTLLDKPYAIVRKEDDNSTHSSKRVEGHLLTRFIVIDDFVASGRTVSETRRVYALELLQETGRTAEFVGVFQYAIHAPRDGRFTYHDV